MTEVVGAALFGSRLAQSCGHQLAALGEGVDVVAWFIVTTSASRPSITMRACLLEPPCDWLTVTSSPVGFFQCAAETRR